VADYVLGERRGEPRTNGADLPTGYALSAPGLRGIEIVDVSPSGVRVRSTTPLRPGRTLTLRHQSVGRPERQVTATVLRCSVFRLGRASVTYEAALQWR
jgi:hypothetical protein